MTRDDLLQYHENICLTAKELMNLKNRDYAGNDGLEPFANFTRVESMGICSTEQGFMTRITDKLSRLSSFLDSGKMNVKDESFNDTIVDVINYMVLLSAYVKEKENINPISDEDSQLYLFEADLSITSPNFQKEIVDIHEC
jgi:hypothetical protein